MSNIANVLTIAGSDSGGGAGIQADLKTMSALGTFGCSVLTALTAQNTRGVTAIHAVPLDFVRAQMAAVFSDIEIAATKIGMLASADLVQTVAEGLEAHRARNVVLDPVMVAKSGDRLLAADAVSALREHLVPRAEVITPNLPEVADLLERPEPKSRSEMRAAGEHLLALGPRHVLVKGGHLSDDPTSPDLLLGAGPPQWLEAPRTATRNTHGTGCSLSSAIAAHLARGLPVIEAVHAAKAWVAAAIARADDLDVGHGSGPIHHFHALWERLDKEES